MLLEKIDPDRHQFLSLIRERKVIEVIAPAREVGCRGNAREGTEVVYEMGLVEVTPNARRRLAGRGVSAAGRRFVGRTLASRHREG